MAEPTIEELIEQRVSSLGLKCSDAEKMKLKQVMRSVIVDNKIPSEAIGMTHEEIEALYRYGYNLFKSGKWKESGTIMQLLMFLDPSQVRFAFGRAASFQMAKDYANAAQVYLMCGLLDESTPIPYYHRAECLLQLNDLIGASFSLYRVIERCGDKLEHQVLKERATIMMDTINKQIEEMTAKKAVKESK